MSWDLDASEMTPEALARLLNGIHERLANLEQAPHKVIERADAWLDTVTSRIEALELAANSADSSLVEALRQDRWWRTYDAALQSYSLYELGEEEMDRRCRAFADVAHGPLGAAQPAPGGQRFACPDWAQPVTLLDIQALVHTARALESAVQLWREWRTDENFQSMAEAERALRAALKPFEP